MDYVTGSEIMTLANKLKELAIKRRALGELRWAPKGEIPDSRFAKPDLPHDVAGGTTSDYALLERSYQWIVDGFENALGPEPAGLDGPIASLDLVRQHLRGDPDKALAFNPRMGKDGKVELQLADDSYDDKPHQLSDSISHYLKGWTGDAATNFVQNFAIPLPEVFRNQVFMVSALRSAVSTNRAVYAMARDDLKGIASAAIDALNFKTGSDGPSVTLTLSVVAGILAVTAACASGPGSIIFFTAASTAAGVTKDIIDEHGDNGDDARDKPRGKEYHIEGATVDTILMSAFDLVRKTQECVQAAEDTIIDGLRKNLDLVISTTTRKDFVSPRPTLADLPTSLTHVRDGYQFYPD